MKPTVISLFAGVGGSSLGYQMAGFEVKLAVEWDDHAVHCYAQNFSTPIWHGDIAKLLVADILSTTGLQIGEIDVLDGSPPCQGFSTAGARRMNDSRNQLFREYVRLLKGLQPKAFVMENVSGMVKGKMKLIFVECLRELKACGYNVSAKVLNAMWYGVPQSRERLIFIGMRNDLKLQPNHPKPLLKRAYTVIEALTGCPNGIEIFLKETHSAYPYWKLMKPGEKASKYHPKGHYFDIKKIAPFKPAPTIAREFNVNRGLMHWKEPRMMSDTELKRLQSFPDDFVIDGSMTERANRIGNSVPPLMMKAIANQIRNDLNGAENL